MAPAVLNRAPADLTELRSFFYFYSTRMLKKGTDRSVHSHGRT